MGDHGFKVVAYNRTTSKVDEFLQGAVKGTNIIGAYSLEDLAAKLEKNAQSDVNGACRRRAPSRELKNAWKSDRTFA